MTSYDYIINTTDKNKIKSFNERINFRNKYFQNDNSIVSYIRENIQHNPFLLKNTIFQQKINYNINDFTYETILYLLKSISPNKMKYKKTLSLQLNKKINCELLLSDVHIEVRLSKFKFQRNALHNLYDELYSFLLQKDKHFYVLLWVDDTNDELLKQLQHWLTNFNIIMITNYSSFLKQHYNNKCYVINIHNENTEDDVNIFTKTNYIQITNTINEKYKNTKLLNQELYKVLINIENSDNSTLREICYNIINYDININDIVYFILSKIDTKIINHPNIFINIINYLDEYLSNYETQSRPIFHIEKLLYNIGYAINNT